MTLETNASSDLTGVDRVTAALMHERRHWITVLVDRSSSMETLRDATIQGVNLFVAEHRTKRNVRLRVVEFGTNAVGDLELTLMFSNEVRGTEDERSLRRLDYRPRGGTPLLAGVTQTIANMEREVQTEDAVLVVVQTDGEDNASPGVTLDMVRARITEKQALGWTFAYLGAELSAWSTANDMAMGALNSFSYQPTPEGVVNAYKVTRDATARWLKGSQSRVLKDSGFFSLQLPAPGAHT